jgi:outer membrane protein assembly factor BamB
MRPWAAGWRVFLSNAGLQALVCRPELMSSYWRRVLPSGRPWVVVMACGCGALGEARLAEPSSGGLQQRRWATIASGAATAESNWVAVSNESALDESGEVEPESSRSRGVATPQQVVRLPEAVVEAASARASASSTPVPSMPLPSPPLPASPGAATPATTSPSEGLDHPEAAPRRLWEFRSAAPMAGAPAVVPGGLVYVASVEGYVHALEPDGRLRWSYGVVGMPVGAPVVDAAGRVYVATSEQRAYGLSADGEPTSLRVLPARFATPLLWVPSGRLYHVGRDQQLYGDTVAGGSPLRRFLGRGVSVELGSLGDGLVAVGTTGAEAEVYRGDSLVARIALPAVLTQPLFGGRERWLALTRSGLMAYDARTHASLWSTSAQRAALSPDQRTLLIESDGELCWLSPQTGLRYARARLPSEASAPPVVTDGGIALVPLVSGELFVVDPSAERTASLRVAPAPAWSPVWDAQAHRAVIAAGDVVAAFDLSDWVRAKGTAEPAAREAASTPPAPSAPAALGTVPVIGGGA